MIIQEAVLKASGCKESYLHDRRPGAAIISQIVGFDSLFLDLFWVEFEAAVFGSNCIWKKQAVTKWSSLFPNVKRFCSKVNWLLQETVQKSAAPSMQSRRIQAVFMLEAMKEIHTADLWTESDVLLRKKSQVVIKVALCQRCYRGRVAVVKGGRLSR